MTEKKLEIILRELPEFGSEIQGELSPEVFALKDNEGTPKTGLQYKLSIQRIDQELLVQGKVEAAFMLECVRTLHPFIKTISVEGLTLSLEIHEEKVDLTDPLREEIMILLPVYPVCEMGDEKMTCNIEEKYLALDKEAKDDLEEPPADSHDDRWAALDQLENL